jgi:DNA polymerase-3 subunit delta
LATEAIKLVYVLVGEDAFLRDQHRARIVNSALGDADPQLCLSILDGDADLELATVLDELRTLPFLAPRRIVIVRQADDFITAHREGLERYVQEPCSSATLILLAATCKTNTKLHKLVQKVGRIIDCSWPQDAKLGRWLADAAAKRKKKFDPAAAEMLAEWIGNDLAALDGEIEKLSLHAGSRDTITMEDVSAVVTATTGPVAFALTNAITRADAPGALKALYGMLQSRGEEFRVLGSLAWHLRRGLASGQKLRAGQPPDKALPGMPAQEKQAFLEMIRRRGPSGLMRDLRRLLRADLAMKTGADPVATLHDVVAGLCRP